MPARIVDGDALWQSSALRRVPTEHRAEFANLIPLAEAYGTFEADPELVWMKVYAFNRPDVDRERVKQILQAFVSADMLWYFRKYGKLWGYWPGIEKKGRLPAEKHRARYKGQAPPPPESLLKRLARRRSGSYPDTVRTLSGGDPALDTDKDLDLDKDLELEHKAPSEENLLANITNIISDLCREILGIRPPLPGSDCWKEIRALTRVYSDVDIASAFRMWAEENQGDSRITYPVSAFLKVADGLLKGSIVTRTSESKKLVSDLAAISGGDVTFDNAQQMQIARLLKDYSADEIKSAFRVYYNRVSGDEFQLKHAARKFPEEAAQLCDVIRGDAAQRESDLAGGRRGAQEMQEREEQLLAAKHAAQTDEPTVDDEDLGI